MARAVPRGCGLRSRLSRQVLAATATESQTLAAGPPSVTAPTADGPAWDGDVADHDSRAVARLWFLCHTARLRWTTWQTRFYTANDSTNMVLQQRMVREVAVDPSGSLHSAGIWELERARGEGHLHRQLAALATASDQAIARFASVHGLLRTSASAHVHAGSAAYWSEQVMRFAQQNWEDADAAIAWARGERIDMPPGARPLAEWFRYLAATTPRPLLRCMRAIARGEPLPIPPEEAERLMRGQTMPVTEMPDTTGLHPEAQDLALAADILEPFVYAMTTQRTLGLQADDPAFGAMTAAFLASAPDAMALLSDDPRAAATVDESTDEWRTTAKTLANWNRLLALLRAAEGNGLSLAEEQEARALAWEVLEWRGPANLRPAEIADRCLPLIALRVEEALMRHGAWPPSPQLPLPTYVRALVALWSDVTGQRPPRPCLTAGCGGTVSGSSKARYCTSCRRLRQRLRVQKRRARDAGPRQ